jgi:hypothetical protein
MISNESIPCGSHPFQQIVVGEFQDVVVKLVVEGRKKCESLFNLQGNPSVLPYAVNFVYEYGFKIKPCGFPRREIKQEADFELKVKSWS